MPTATASPARPTSALTADLTADRPAPRPARLSRDAEGWLFGIIGVVAFSFSLPATKTAVPHFGWLMTSLGRAEVAALLAAVVLLARRERLPRRGLWLPIVVSGLGVIIGFPLLTSIALRDVSSAHGAVVTGLLPAATAAFAVWRGHERPPRAFWGAVAFGVLAVLVFAGVQGAGRPRWQDLLLVGAVLCASFGYAEGTRIAREIGGWQVISWALVATAPLIAPIVIADLPGRSWDAPWSAWLGFAYVSLVSMFLVTSIALRDVSSAHGAVVTGLLPAATAAFAVWRGHERPPRAFWGAVAFGVLAVLVFAGVQGAGRPRWQDLLLVGAVLCASFGYAEGTRIAREIGGWQVISWALVATAPLIAPFVVADLPGRSWDAPWSAWLGFAYVSLVSMFLGFVFWYRGLALGGTARVGQAQLAQPVLTLIWSALLLGEHVGPAEMITGAVVVASVALTRRFRSPTSPAATVR